MKKKSYFGKRVLLFSFLSIINLTYSKTNSKKMIYPILKLKKDTILDKNNLTKIEEVKIYKSQIKKTKKNNNTLTSVFRNNFIASLIYQTNKSKNKLKSITILPSFINTNGEQILGNVNVKLVKKTNSLPDFNNCLIDFNLNLNQFNTKQKKWKLTFPKVITLPNENIFFVLKFEINSTPEDILLWATKENPMYLFNEKTKEWQNMPSKGYYYELELTK